MSDAYGPSGGQVLRRAVLLTIACVAAAFTVPRLLLDEGLATAPPAARTHVAPPPSSPAAPAPSRSAATPVPESGFTQSYRANSGNQFFVKASVNGVAIPFLVDTGATFVALRAEDAQRLGFTLSSLRWDVPMSTANGRSFAAAVTLADIRLGDIVEYGVPAVIHNQGLGISLLGMSFLSRLKSWHIADGVLTIAY
jgi:clan AA aspartic protease (TIGR02281 family)